MANPYWLLKRRGPKPRAVKRRSRGFTLVEALAAVVIIAVVLPVAMRGISLAAVVASRSHQRVEAAELARMKLNELVVTGEYGNGSQSGEFGVDAPGFRWIATTESWNDSSMQLITVQVTWRRRNVEEVVSMSTLAAAEEL